MCTVKGRLPGFFQYFNFQGPVCHASVKVMLPKSNMSPMVKVWPDKASMTSLRSLSKKWC